MIWGNLLEIAAYLFQIISALFGDISKTLKCPLMTDFSEMYRIILVSECGHSMFLGGLRVTNPTIRLVCPSVCPSVCPFVSLVNMITPQILIALGPNLFHGCILGVSWLSSKMDDHFNMKICKFRL